MSERQPHQNRRTTMVVNKELQKQIVMSISFFPAIGLALAMCVVAVFSHRLGLEALQADVELSNVVPLFLSVSVFVTMAGIFLLLAAKKASHRVAGPGYRICQSLKRMREGDLAFRVRLREGDFLGEVSDELNLFLDWLNENPPPGVNTDATQREKDAAEAAEAAEAAVAAAAVEDALAPPTPLGTPTDDDSQLATSDSGASREQTPQA